MTRLNRLQSWHNKIGTSEIIPESCFIDYCISSIKAFLDGITLQLELPGIFQDKLYVIVLFPAVFSNFIDPLNVGPPRCQLRLFLKIM